MDKETVIFLAIFMTIAVGFISLAFPRRDRIKVFYVAGGFASFFVSTIISIWIIKNVIPESVSWFKYVLVFFVYSALLCFWMGKIGLLADDKKVNERNNEEDGSGNG